MTVGPGVAMFATAIGGPVPGNATGQTIESDGYTTTYYPGTLSADEAQAITVGVAEEANASFALVPARMTRISGVGPKLARAAAGGRRPWTSHVEPASGMFARAMRVSRTGWNLHARQRAARRTCDRGLPFPGPGMNFGARAELEETAAVNVTAGGETSTILSSRQARARRSSGRVVFEGSSLGSRPGRILAVRRPIPGCRCLIRIGGQTTASSTPPADSSLRGVRAAHCSALRRSRPARTPRGRSSRSRSTAWTSPTRRSMSRRLDDVNGVEIVLTDKRRRCPALSETRGASRRRTMSSRSSRTTSRKARCRRGSRGPFVPIRKAAIRPERCRPATISPPPLRRSSRAVNGIRRFANRSSRRRSGSGSPRDRRSRSTCRCCSSAPAIPVRGICRTRAVPSNPTRASDPSACQRELTRHEHRWLQRDPAPAWPCERLAPNSALRVGPSLASVYPVGTMA